MPAGPAKAVKADRTNQAGAAPNGWLVFALLCAAYLGISFFTSTYVLTEEVYIQSLGNQLPAERIKELLEVQDRWWWVGYVLQPLLLAIKVGYTALCLAVGFVLAERSEVRFGRLFKAALLAEGVFVLAGVVRIVWAKWGVGIETIEDFSTAAPLSALALFDASSLPQWALYPLQTFSVFELLYCVVLGCLLGWLRSERTDDMLILTFGSYGAGLVLWVVFVAFLSLQVSS